MVPSCAHNLLLAIMALAVPLASASLKGQTSIQKDLARIDWQPTQAPPNAHYVGRETCTQCHPDIAATQKSSGMAHALELPQEASALSSHSQLSVNLGPFRYTLQRHGNQVIYTVTNGTDTISEPLVWAVGFGTGEVGQTYIFKHDGAFYESRVSFFNQIRGLDLTLGHASAVPGSLEESMGRRLSEDELKACLGCHSTAAVGGGRLQVDRMLPGITCEGCHGPGGEHVSAMRAGKLQPAHIFNPSTLLPGDLVKFCGACHRTQRHVESLQVQGILTVRFQPYRLMESRCFDPRDCRISCLTCHNPHEDPKREPAFYDSKCLACHGGGLKDTHIGPRHASACPAAKANCVTCHMPRYELAGSHYKFTDHRIRVLRLGDTFD